MHFQRVVHDYIGFEIRLRDLLKSKQYDLFTPILQSTTPTMERIIKHKYNEYLTIISNLNNQNRVSDKDV